MVDAHDKIFDMLMEQSEITWQSIIFDLVKQEGMDPWDINLSLLAKKFITTVKTLKDMDFRISGRIILATAILLRLKSSKLIDEDINELDKLIASNQEIEEGLYEEIGQEYVDDGAVILSDKDKEQFTLIPRTPQPRKRKISVYDLVDALNKALEVKVRRESRIPSEAPQVIIPSNVRDISVMINQILSQVRSYYTDKKKSKLTFSKLIASDSRDDKIFTFIPLLHLTNQRIIELEQTEHFGDIHIHIKSDKPAVVIENEEE